MLSWKLSFSQLVIPEDRINRHEGSGRIARPVSFFRKFRHKILRKKLATFCKFLKASQTCGINAQVLSGIEVVGAEFSAVMLTMSIE